MGQGVVVEKAHTRHTLGARQVLTHSFTYSLILFYCFLLFILVLCMWLSEEEREKVLTDTLAGFLAASPDDIQHAARLLANRPAPSSKNMKEVLEQMIGTRPGIFQKKNKGVKLLPSRFLRCLIDYEKTVQSE